jgi:lysylphosphatidylglycerol synthetase-like protein (DUF2156 family)
MTKIYRESFHYFLRSLPILLGFAAVIEVGLWLLQPKHEFSLTFVALVLVAYSFHRHFLFGEALTFSGKPPADARPYKFGWFLLMTAVLTVVSVGISIAIAFGSLDRAETGGAILIFLPVYLVTLSAFGTALPATVARDGTYRVSQGIRATFSAMWRLVLGPGVAGLVILVLTVLAGMALQSLAVAEDSLVTLAVYIIVRTLGFLTTIFAVAVLCEMYRKTRPEPRVTQDPGALGQTPA